MELMITLDLSNERLRLPGSSMRPILSTRHLFISKSFGEFDEVRRIIAKSPIVVSKFGYDSVSIANNQQLNLHNEKG